MHTGVILCVVFESALGFGISPMGPVVQALDLGTGAMLGSTFYFITNLHFLHSPRVISCVEFKSVNCFEISLMGPVLQALDPWFQGVLGSTLRFYPQFVL